jgi:hypothetical protein
VALSLTRREIVILGTQVINHKSSQRLLDIRLQGRSCAAHARCSPLRTNDNLTDVVAPWQYAGEMKKGVFSLMHYLMPKCHVLSLHSGCNIGPAGDVSLFFGLSGTGINSPASQSLLASRVKG